MVSAIDPVTGAPIALEFPQIQQIMLGLQTVPFDDLKATSRPSRLPLYGDDLIPTSSLLTAIGNSGTMRAATMDDFQNLYVRDSQMQSYGNIIADGDNGPIDVSHPNFQSLGNPYVGGVTGPLDVNLASNTIGVAGNAPVSGHNVQISGTGEIFGQTYAFTGDPDPHYSHPTHIFQYITAVDASWAFNTAVTTAGFNTEFDVALTDNNTLPNWRMNLVRIPYAVLTAGTAPTSYIHKQMTFTPPFDLFATLGGVTDFFIETLVHPGFDGYFTLAIWGY